MFTTCIKGQFIKAVFAILSFGLLTAAVQYPRNPQDPPDDGKLPNGKSRSEEILKSDHQDNLKDVEKMRKLLEGVETELKKYDQHVLNAKSIKDLEELEKISRKLRGRMGRF